MSRGYRVRFHLAKGEHYMHWQVKNLDTKQVNYYDPEEFSLYIIGATLKNQKATAEKIHAGENKSVCAWVNCEEVHASKHSRLIVRGPDKMSYNPRRAPYWTDSTGRNMDNMSFLSLTTAGRAIGMPTIKNSVLPYLGKSCQEVPIGI